MTFGFGQKREASCYQFHKKIFVQLIRFYSDRPQLKNKKSSTKRKENLDLFKVDELLKGYLQWYCCGMYTEGNISEGKIK